MTSCMKHISFGIVLGIIYDVIVEPPSVGSTTDEFGHSKPVSLEHSSQVWNTRITSKHCSKGLIGRFVSKTASVRIFACGFKFCQRTPLFDCVLFGEK